MMYDLLESDKNDRAIHLFEVDGSSSRFICHIHDYTESI